MPLPAERYLLWLPAPLLAGSFIAFVVAVNGGAWLGPSSFGCRVQRFLLPGTTRPSGIAFYAQVQASLSRCVWGYLYWRRLL